MSKPGARTIVTAILGAGGVGKSALTLRFVYDEFVEEYEPTKSDAYTKTVSINGKEHPTSIIDTAGQEDYDFQRDNYIRNSEGFFCVFSLADKESFDATDDLLEKIVQIKNTSQIVAVLVGNKKDIVEEDTSKRKVSHYDAEAKAAKYGIKYMETSAKTNMGVQDMFLHIVEEVAKRLPADEGQEGAAKKSKKKFKCRVL